MSPKIRSLGQELEDAPSLEVRGFGLAVRAVSGQLAMAMALLFLFAGLCAGIYIHHASVMANDQRIEQQITELIYIIALPQEKREALNIEMPDTLRQKLRHRRGLPEE